MDYSDINYSGGQLQFPGTVPSTYSNHERVFLYFFLQELLAIDSKYHKTFHFLPKTMLFPFGEKSI